MSSIVEVSESGTLQLPTEILKAIGPNTRFVVEVEGDRLILSPVPPKQPFWATATPEERAERLMQWVQSHQNGANLPDTELRSKIVAEIDTETRGRGDAEKMNMLRMNATWYDEALRRENIYD